MIKKAIKITLSILLVLVVLIVGTGLGAYLYLKPDKAPPRLLSPDTVRVVESGELIGFESQNITYAWLGIPYSAPPVGELRWKAPQPPEQWTGRFEAMELGSECPQKAIGPSAEQNAVNGAEDCLFLNIWAPAATKGIAPADRERRPVMFWIHGGANVMGSGGHGIYDGARLAGKHNMVVVTINHRLGPFGWFTHPALRSEEASPADNSGNYGTLDIIRALNWVQGNIGVFGGDPENVTIFGESAGGWNVLTMMVSPPAKGLFHRAISQSGGLDITPVADAENYVDDEPEGHQFSSKEIVNNLLAIDGSATDRDAAKTLQESMSAAKIAAYLYGKSPEEIFAAYQADGEFSVLPNRIGDGYVLPKDMTTAEIFSHIINYNSVPVILGTNRDESKLFMIGMGDEWVDKVFGIPVGIKDDFAYERNNRYGTDQWKVTAVDRLAGYMRDVQGETVFAYRFDADDWRHLGFIDLQKLVGAAHGLEVLFVFGNFPNPMRILYPGSTVPARNRLSDSMMSYWAEFAHTGNPGKGRSGAEVPWTPWQNGDKNRPRLMVLDTELDRGIRMSSQWLTLADLKARFLADESFTSQKKYCERYKSLFEGDDFVPSEYQTLGNGGCTE